MSRTLGVLVVMMMTTCGALAGSPACVVAGLKPMIVAQLFFGRDVRGRAPVSDSEWSEFVGRVVAKAFPDGFTIEDGEGEWRDPVSGHVVRERSKILVVAAAPSDLLAGRLRSIIDAYRKAFHQTSVGLVTSQSCGAF